MPFDIVIGRSKKDTEKYGTDGSVFLGKQYVHMGQVTSLSNNVYLDVSRSHVVFVAGKRGSGKCLHEDSIVTLSDGSQISIKKLENKKEKIFAVNNELKMQTASQSDFYKRDVTKLLKIKLRTGKEIKLTPEHPLLTVKGWMPADQLHIGSRVATPRQISAFGEGHLSEAEVKVIAYLTAEGHLGNHFVLFANSDKKIVQDFIASIKDFDINLKVKMHSSIGCYRVVENRKRVIIKQAERNEKGQFSSKPIVDSKSSIRKWLDKLQMYGKLAHQRELPSIIFNLPVHKMRLFLNRLFSCDGSIFKSSSHWQLSYSSSSERLIKQVHHLLLRFGIISTIRKKETKCLLNYEIQIWGEHVHTFLSEIGFYGVKEKRVELALKEAPKIVRNPNKDTIPKEIWEIYKPDNWAEIGRKLHYSIPKSFRESKRYAPSRQKLLQIARADENDLLEKLATSDIYWDEIVHLEIIEGNFTVYDITVPKHHNFVANDIIVHNSYSMGVIAEGITTLPKDVRQNLSIILLDTMGVYWTMKYPNHKDNELLKEWRLEGQGLDIMLFTPSGFYDMYKEKGIPTDKPFAVKPSDLHPEDWCLTFGLDVNSTAGVLIARLVQQLKKTVKEYSLQEVIVAVQNDKRSDEHTKNVVVNHFAQADGWGIFSKEGTPLKDLVAPGQVTVLDMSPYATMPNGWLIKSIVIGLISKKLFAQRMIARKNEEYNQVDQAMHYFSKETKEKLDDPLVWISVDEAHEFLPREGKTVATDALITILREGRQPGISLLLATQQPGKIHTDVITQSDVVLAHRLTAQVDVRALGELTQTYMQEGLSEQLFHLPRTKGSGVVFDDQNERVFAVKIRPRFTWHGGSAPTAIIEKKEMFAEPEKKEKRVFSGLE